MKLIWKLPYTAILLIAACGTQLSAPYTLAPKMNATETPSTKPVAAAVVKATAKPYPTLAFDLQDQFYSLLKTNRNCELPCFLGIKPGQTLWLDAKAQLEKFSDGSIQPDNVASTPTFTVYYVQIQTNRDIELLLRIRLEVDASGVVQYIVFDANIYRDGRLITDDQHFSIYSLRKVFQTYGQPDAIYIALPNDGVYSLQVVYEKLKFVINLTGLAKQNAAGKYLICPNIGDGDITTLQIALASAVDPQDVKTLISYPFYKSEDPLDKVTSLSLEDIYLSMIGSHQPACFQVK